MIVVSPIFLLDNNWWLSAGAWAWQCLIGWLFLRPCVGACKCGIVGSTIVCSSSWQELIPTWKRCWAGAQEQKGRVGPQEAKGTSFPTASLWETVSVVCFYLCAVELLRTKLEIKKIPYPQENQGPTNLLGAPRQDILFCCSALGSLSILVHEDSF